MEIQRNTGPQLLVETCPAQAGAARGQWLVEWVVRNLGREPLRLLAARAPHGKFRSDELDLASMPDLSPDEGTRLQLLVSCDEPDGAVIENAFLILRLLWRDQPWRVFARMRVAIGKDGSPECIIEVVTTHRIGFQP